MYRMFFVSNGTPEAALRLLVRHRVSITNWLPRAYKPRIKAIPGVVDVATFQYFGGTYKDARESKNSFSRFGVDPREFLRIYGEYVMPEGQKRAFLQQRDGCLVGRGLAERLGWKVGDRVHIKGDIFPLDLDLVVRAIYDSQSNNTGFFFHFEYLTEGLRGRDFAGMYVLLVDRPESVTPVSAEIDRMFRNSTAQTKTESERAMQLSFLSYLGNVKAFLLTVCSALTLAVLMVSANTMGMSVRERIRETGVMKTLGFTSEDILGLLLGEAVVIALIGAAIGLGISAVIVEGLRNAPVPFVDMHRLQMPALLVTLSLVLAAGEGLISAWIPARSAAKMSIVEALGKLD